MDDRTDRDRANDDPALPPVRVPPPETGSSQPPVPLDPPRARKILDAQRKVMLLIAAAVAVAATVAGFVVRSTETSDDTENQTSERDDPAATTPGVSSPLPAEEEEQSLAGVPVLPPAQFPGAAGPPPVAPALADKPTEETGNRDPIYKVPLGSSPWTGASEPLATLIVFTDFQCPHCANVAPVLRRLLDRYGRDLRVVYKALPLAMHPNAGPAAEAAAEAQAQGKFWEYQDLLFANHEHLERTDLERYAAQAGLDVARLRAALDAERNRASVDADKALAARFGIRGTPSFVLNGKSFAGALPYEQFEARVVAAIADGRALLDRGVPRGAIYDTLVRDGLPAAPVEAPARPSTPSPRVPVRPAEQEIRDVRADIWNPVLGSAGAPVTLIVFGEYLCPYCKRIDETFTQLLDAYPGRLRIVYRNFIVHPQAELLARAALAAHRQGSFRALHTLFFANMDTLRNDTQAGIDRLAAQAGLDVRRLHRDMESDETRKQLEADRAEGSRVGVTGTPTTFLNGRKVSGSQSVDSFRTVIDDLLGIVRAP